jgi:hypothetical protein
MSWRDWVEHVSYRCESALDGLLRALRTDRAESKSPSKALLILEDSERRDEESLVDVIDAG